MIWDSQFPTVRAFKNVKTIEDGQELVIAGTEITVMETPDIRRDPFCF